MRWSYKTVHFSLKKDGLLGSAFLDEDEIEISLNEYGHAGWELVSLVEVNDGLIAVFKQQMSQGIAPVETSAPVKNAAAPEEELPTEKASFPATEDDSTAVAQPEGQEESRKESENDVGSIRIF
ncbi:MAG: DUF4177 domain-containing protein [Desulfocapsa sp.]|nr:DUF4177 domain-containing protein [Desulfocapsa sp.]